MFQLDFGDHRPIYEQIKDRFKNLIISGALSEHEKLPSVRELAGTLAINPNTIQKAYRDLESEGYIYSLRARGSFVAPQSSIARQEQTGRMLSELEELLQKMKFCGVEKRMALDAVEQVYQNEERM